MEVRIDREIKPWKPDPKAAKVLASIFGPLWAKLQENSHIPAKKKGELDGLYDFEPSQLAYHFSVALAKRFGDRWEVKLGAESEEVTMPTPAQISLYFKVQSAKAAAKLKGTSEAVERARKAGRAKKRPRRKSAPQGLDTSS
jgi:hypothetical protein